MGEIVSIPGERYGSSVSITDGMIAIGTQIETSMPGTVVTRMGTADIRRLSLPSLHSTVTLLAVSNIFGARQGGGCIRLVLGQFNAQLEASEYECGRDKDGIVVQHKMNQILKKTKIFF